MRIAAIQFDFDEHDDFDERVDQMLGLVERAAHGADLVVLPELWPNGGFTYQLWDATAQALDGSVVSAMREAARRASVVLHAGSFIERHPDGSLTNTAVVLERDGSVNAVYRKIHLFGFAEGEPKFLAGGDEVVVAETSVGRLGLATCYDLRFPEQFRRLTDAGCDAFVVPAAWPMPRVTHWTVLARARAIENQTPLVAVNTAGTHAGVQMGGHSIVVDALGVVLAEAGEGEQVLRTEIDSSVTVAWRERFPALGDRRLCGRSPRGGSLTTMSTVHPETGRFAETFGQMGAALDEWLRSERIDPLRSPTDWRSRLTAPVPRDGVGADETLREFLSLVLPHGPHLTTDTSWAWITTGPTTVPTAIAAASMIASPQRQTLTAFNLLEEQALEWIASMCGLGEHMRGVFSSGGSTANLVALGAARQWSLEQLGIDPSGDGFDASRVAMYTSDQAHHTVQRSAGVLGIGRGRVRAIPTDDQMRMDVDALEAAIKRDVADGITPVAVIVAAGTTNTGSIDPIRRAGEVAKQYGAWFHVDGAYGLPGVLDSRISHLYDGLDLADSVITDPHKWLNTPVGVAATFVRDRSILYRAFTQEPADYLEGAFAEDDVVVSLDSMGTPYYDFGVELSSPVRGVIVWGVLRELGVDGVRTRVVQDNDFARHVAARAREHPRLETLLDPVLSICVFRYVPEGIDSEGAINDANREILRRLARETRFVVSSTMVRGQFALRPCFINPRSTLADVDEFVDAVISLGEADA